MRNRVLLAVAVVALASCGQRGNPLLAASDGEFARWIEPRNAFSPSCAAALYEPDLFVRQYNGLKFSSGEKISAVSEQQKADCVAELQKQAPQLGIRGQITREHLFDDRVRKRYLAAR